ncbi:hypothetical protein VTJ83DRAFT_7026 [Remersonia thermophila]|uniref:6-phosphogluconolactonase n=1 Tax=Remersonia thermophila TaxID=72144 RepID=A0ABR4D3T6_9PEZI
MSRILALIGAAALTPSALGATLIASHFSGQIYTLQYTGTNSSGTLAITSQTSGCGTTPGWIEYYGDTRQLYCFDESWWGNGAITEYAVGNDGRLSITGQGRSRGNSVHGALYGGSNGRGFVATAEYSPSTITTYRLPLNSGAAALSQTRFTLPQRGPHPRQDASHPHEIHVDPTGRFMLVPDLGADLIRIFRIDANTGALYPCPEARADRGAGPRHVKFWKSADGQKQKVYSVNELANTVSAWDVTYPSQWDANGCLALTRTQTLSTFAPGRSGGSMAKAAELRVVDNFLYATNRADQAFGSQQDSIATYTIDPTTGAISWFEAANSFSYYPRTFAFNKEGTLAAIGGQTSSNVAIVQRDPVTGRLGRLIATIQVGARGRPGEEDGLSAVVWAE